MDVQCERCKTEYEFDDALVSGRGTTVKCTNCGFQFKIRPANDAPEAERWNVQTVAGQSVVFTSLRELQKAISNRQVGRGDTLGRGNAPPRPLGSIAELEPFFSDSGGKAHAAAVWRDPPNASNPPAHPQPQAQHQSSRPPPPVPKRGTGRSPHDDEAPPVRGRVDTLRPPSEMSAAVPPPTPHPAAVAHAPPPAAFPAQMSAAEVEAPTREYLPQQQQPPPPPQQHYPPQRAETPRPPPLGMPRRPEGPSAPPPRVQYVEAPRPPSVSPPTQPMRGRIPSYDDLADSNLRTLDDEDVAYAMPKNRRVGGWVVAAIVLAGASGLGYYAFRPYLATLTHANTAASAIDPRATQFLNDGERALGDGNLDSARSSFDKASALAEKDARVLLDLARLAAVRADVPWLKIRLLPADAPEDDLVAAKQSLEELSATARKAADLALAAAPEDPGAIRAKVDALRIAGDRDGARAMVAKIIGSAAQPETAYVLAALDLAEIDPLWPTILDRLRLAAAGEGNAGRARAALVYALARSGDATAAKAELDKLAALAKPHPLLGALRAFLAKGAPPRAAADGGGVAAKAPPGSVDVASLPVVRPGAAPAGGGGGGAIAGDPRVLLQQAESAKNRGDYDRAKMLYEATLARSAGDSQALAGLGDCARAQHDGGSAKSFYQRALASNPNYLPALIGLADVELEEGDQPRAQKGYKDIVDRFPEGSYPSRVKQRSESASPPAAAAPTPTAAATATTKEVTLPANTPSDLPGTPP